MTGLAPVRGRARIEILDILRGIAILGIFYMNIPYMGQNGSLSDADIRRIGWTLADRNVWAFIDLTWEGTQRGLLEFLFGAGAMLLTARAMTPDGPVAVADLFYRRNLWLIGFGLLDIFLITWIGDILLVYGLAALFIFPFRKLPARVLIPLGLLFAAGSAVSGGVEYHSRAVLMEKAGAVEAKQAAKVPLTKADQDILKDWQKKHDRLDLRKPLEKDVAAAVKQEADAHRGNVGAYYLWAWTLWKTIFVDGYAAFFTVLEAICGMFLGMAFWKLGIIQGQRSMRFYAVLALAAYGVGMGSRAIGVMEVLSFQPIPKTMWISYEFGRLAVSLGHLALVNLLVQTAAGRAVLAPFRAAGQTAFSLYILTSIIGLWLLFQPWGLNLWGRHSWAGLALIATLVNVGLLILANVWMRHFVSGPLEWLWRSLAYWERQPFRRHEGERAAPAEPGGEVPPLPA